MLAQKVHVSIGSIADWEKIKPIYLSSFPRNEPQPLKTTVNRITSKQKNEIREYFYNFALTL